LSRGSRTKGKGGWFRFRDESSNFYGIQGDAVMHMLHAPSINLLRKNKTPVSRRSDGSPNYIMREQ
jgi:hypothetical protein